MHPCIRLVIQEVYNNLNICVVQKNLWLLLILTTELKIKTGFNCEIVI